MTARGSTVCGFAGQVGRAAPPEDAAAAASTALRHRGPDSHGEWRDDHAGVVLVHRRLAIRDLSPAGAQPMVSSAGTHVVAYNGELYALDGLRGRLGARRLRGSSDTEVLVEACAEWGVDRVLPELIGMFAFALWDTRGRELTLVRDRMGIKPLYWSAVDGELRFASELGALVALGGPTGGLDHDALAGMLALNHLPGDRTPYRQARRLRPGELLRWRDGELRRERWWRLGHVLAAAASTPSSASSPSRSDDEGLAALDETVRTAVRDRLVADVPLGSLLSGGIDSSLITAVMAETSSMRVRTYSIGFADPRYDEAAHAQAVAAHLGTEHTELEVTEADAVALVPDLPAMFGEPFADASAIPTALVFRLARRHVTVALSGDGGDEVFGGYPRYWRTRGLIEVADGVPRALRPGLGRAVGVGAGLVGGTARGPWGRRADATGRWLRKTSAVLAAADTATAHRAVLQQWPDPLRLVPGAAEVASGADDAVAVGPLSDPLDVMQAVDLASTLPDDILTKVDRTSMRVGLEARVPLLDHRVLAAAWSLPRHLRVDGRTGKVALRRLLARRVPPALWDRPKRGFSVPLATWLRGPLRPWAEDLLSAERLRAGGVLAVDPVRDAWRRHLAGGDRADALWGVLMLQAWLLDDRIGPRGGGRSLTSSCDGE